MFRYITYSRLTIILLLFTISSLAQNSSIIDSLDNKDFTELKDTFYIKLREGKTETAKQIATYTGKKAKQEANFEVLTNSFIRLHFTAKNLEIAEKYIDSAIDISKKNNILRLLNEGYFYKGIINFNLSNQEKALSYYIKARDYFKDVDDVFYNRIQHKIGFLKLRIGNYEEATQIFKENSKFKIDTIRFDNHLSTLYCLGLAYVGLKKHDSATFIFNEGILLSAKNYGYYKPTIFQKGEAANHFFRGNYNIAKDIFLKITPYFIERNLNKDLSECYFYLGKINIKNNNSKRATQYYEKVDSLYKISGYLIPEFRDAYQGILNYYKTKGNTSKELYYTKRLLEIDSTINKEFRYYTQTLHKDYDTKNLINNHDKLLKKERNSFKLYYIILLVLLTVTGIGFIFNFYKRKKDQKKFLKLIQSDSLITPKVSKQNFKSNSLDISDDIIIRVLDELDVFEKKKGFLNKKISLSSLSKKTKTNPKYLSKIINTHKHKTFRNYVNDLRINYILDCLKNDSKFKKYTVKAISEEAGFSNPESFTKAFKKHTELTVSYFLKKMNQSS